MMLYLSRLLIYLWRRRLLIILTDQYNNHNVEVGERTSRAAATMLIVKRDIRLNLSMKYVNQDNGLDLDVSNDQLANDMLLSQESSSLSHGNSGRDNNTNNNARTTNESGGGGGGVNNSHLLERALASNIGISCAIDPGNLILKGKSRTGNVGGGGNLVNGYALVGEDEDEEEPSSELMSMSTNYISAAATASSTPSLRPLGRGRGTTLPAWMTKRDEDEDRLGHTAELPDDDDDDDDDNGVEDGDRSSRRRNEKKRSRTKSKSSRRRRHDNNNDDDDDDYDRSRRRNEKKKQKRRHHRRRRSSSSLSSESDHMSRHRRQRSSLSSEGSSGNRGKGKR
jgi:hypothetical protein